MSSPLKAPAQPPLKTVRRRTELLPSPLIDALIQAARDNDRGRFDKCFDECFEELWTQAFRTTGDAAEAEAMTEQILFDVVRGR